MKKATFLLAILCAAVHVAYGATDLLAPFKSFLNDIAVKFTTFVNSLPRIGPKEVCYDKYGCFSIEAPFNTPGRIADLPDNPEKIGTQFRLFTRSNPSNPSELKFGNVPALQWSNYNGRLRTKIIVPGWNDYDHPWAQQMKNSFLKSEDCNVILIRCPDYQSQFAKAAANGRVVGAQIAEMVRWLVAQTGTNLTSFHLLGHSLGAHVAGYAGERLMPGLGRITGMDPAGPFFQDTHRSVRLDETDAEFVDVLHSDGGSSVINMMMLQGGFAISTPSGHIDIYANGGLEQPGCNDIDMFKVLTSGGDIAEEVRFVGGCRHMRGYEYPNETLALESCPWRVYSCDGGWEKFRKGLCLRCPITGDTAKYCNSMLSRAVKPLDGSVNNAFYMATGRQWPYCRFHFHVKFELQGNSNNDQTGNVWAKFFDEQNSTTTDFLQFGEGSIAMKSGGSYDFLVLARVAVANVTSIELKWESNVKPDKNTPSPTIYPKTITIFSGEFQTESTFIDGSQTALRSGESRRYHSEP